MNEKIGKILVSGERLAAHVKRLAAEIDRDYKDKKPLFICVLKGAFVFAADLLRAVTIPAQVEFMRVSSYGADTVSSGNVQIVQDTDLPIKGRHIILIEDIVDSGLTLASLKSLLEKRDAASVRLCAMLDKPERREADIVPDYLGESIPNEFVVGYGLDYNEMFRELPCVAVLKPEVYVSSE